MSASRLIAVGGGKGGVGKSLVAANLAVSLAQAGAEVVILDADLGAPNLHTLFGIYRPGRTVDDFLEGRVGSLAEVALDTGISRVRLVCGSPPVLGSANPTWALRQRLIRQLPRLGAQVLLIDVGAGVDFKVIDFFNAADIRLVVVTPEMTSLQNAYGFVKIAIYRRLQRAVAGHPVTRKLSDAFGEGAFQIASGMEKMSTFLSLVADEAPELIEPFRLLLREFNPQIVGNMIAKQTDLNPVWAIQRMMKEFLGLDAEISTTLRASPLLRSSVNSGKPFVLDCGGDLDAMAFAKLARKILEQDLRPIEKMRASIAGLLASSGASAALGLDDVGDAAGDRSGESAPPSRRISIPMPPPDSQRVEATPAAATEAIHDTPIAAAHQATSPPEENPSPEGTPIDDDAPPPPTDSPSAATEPEAAPAPLAAEVAAAIEPVAGAGAHCPVVAVETDAEPEPAARAPAPIAAPRREALTPAEAAGISAPDFEREHQRFSRVSDRFVLNHPLEVEVDGHWYIGTLIEMNDAGALVAGIGALARGRENGAVRVMAMSRSAAASDHEAPVAVRFAAYDRLTGGTVVHFVEPRSAEPLVAYFRRLAEAAE
ncbi:MAG: P-loop NTPase [Deltaproteobacteria bacterium]|nr:P-loop NTPase [Deltaproteobacteria bacterium]